MTRIRSTREIRITGPVPPGNDSTRHAAERSGTAGDASVEAGRFSSLYDVAQQRGDHGAAGQTPDDAPRDDSWQAGDDDAHGAPADGIAETTAGAPQLTCPPLPPLHPLTSALLELRKNFRTSAANPRALARGSANAALRRQPQQSSPNTSADEQLGIEMIRRCARAAEGDLLAQHLAEHVAGFCTSPVVDRTGQWEIAVELDPAILARTQLHLRLSGSALTLRFDSRDPRGRQLICDNSNELKTRLEARLGGQTAVEITVL